VPPPTAAPDAAADAVVVDRVTKRFAGEKRRHWPWSPRSVAPTSADSDAADAEATKRAGVTAIDRISLTIRKNEIYGVLGSNGSGKSTLIRLLSTLLLPDEGRITVFGHDVVRDEARVRRLINRVSVEASFFKKLSPLENLYYAVRLYGLDGAHSRPAIVRTMRELGIAEDRLHRPLEEMSRGMQQKVAIARAFLTSPVLLLLDEPTTGLDPRSKRDVQRFVRRLRDDHDATILLTTHDMAEADALCERIAILDHGRIVVEATPAGLKARAATPEAPAPSLEDAFMHFTGHAADPEAAEEEATAEPVAAS
jgi:ABC-2 type transport system ATP-binding protein